MRRCILIWLTLCLSACGFHLRGKVQLAPPLKKMYVQSKQPYGTLERYLKQSLKLSGVQVTEYPEQASTILVIMDENLGQQMISVAGTQLTRQYNLSVNVTFEITNNKGEVLVPPQALTEVQPITIRSDQILAGSAESNNMYQQMRRLIVYDIMSRISSRQVTHLIEHPNTP